MKSTDPAASVEHTPGPWKVIGRHIHTTARFAESKHPDGTACIAEHSLGWPRDIETANLNVIAVAPELLKVGGELLRLYDAGIRPKQIKGMYREGVNFEQAILDLKNLVAKAKVKP